MGLRLWKYIELGVRNLRLPCLEICDRPKKLVFKSFKRYFFVFRDTTLSLYHSFEEKDGVPLLKYNLKGW